MLYDISRTDVWVGEIEDRPGALAEKLETLANSGANLEFIVLRRDYEKPATTVVFVSPLRGAAANEAGLSKATTMFTLRVEGPHIPGLGARIARAIGDEDINMRGLTGASVGERSVIYIGFERIGDVDRAVRVLNKLLAQAEAEAGC